MECNFLFWAPFIERERGMNGWVPEEEGEMEWGFIRRFLCMGKWLEGGRREWYKWTIVR